MFTSEPRYLTRAQEVVLRKEICECKRDGKISAVIAAVSLMIFQGYVDRTMGEKSFLNYAREFKIEFVALSGITTILVIGTLFHFYLIHQLNKRISNN